MSEADKMFEDLGYEWNMLVSVANGKQWGVSYKNSKTLAEIAFDYEDKEICTSCFETDEPVYIGMQELQAINEKCKELGWL